MISRGFSVLSHCLDPLVHLWLLSYCIILSLLSILHNNMKKQNPCHQFVYYEMQLF